MRETQKLILFLEILSRSLPKSADLICSSKQSLLGAQEQIIGTIWPDRKLPISFAQCRGSDHRMPSRDLERVKCHARRQQQHAV